MLLFLLFFVLFSLFIKVPKKSFVIFNSIETFIVKFRIFQSEKAQNAQCSNGCERRHERSQWKYDRRANTAAKIQSIHVNKANILFLLFFLCLILFVQSIPIQINDPNPTIQWTMDIYAAESSAMERILQLQQFQKRWQLSTAIQPLPTQLQLLHDELFGR